MIDELAHLAEALATLGDLTPRSLDAISAYGERCRRFSASPRSAGRAFPQSHVDACEVMITDSTFGRRRAAGGGDRRRVSRQR